MNYRRDFEVELEYEGQTVTAQIDAEIDYDDDVGRDLEDCVYFHSVVFIRDDDSELDVIKDVFDGEHYADTSYDEDAHPLFKVLNQKVLDHAQAEWEQECDRRDND